VVTWRNSIGGVPLLVNVVKARKYDPSVNNNVISETRMLQGFKHSEVEHGLRHESTKTESLDHCKQDGECGGEGMVGEINTTESCSWRRSITT
jgi:hypothetical protein